MDPSETRLHREQNLIPRYQERLDPFSARLHRERNRRYEERLRQSADQEMIKRKRRERNQRYYRNKIKTNSRPREIRTNETDIIELMDDDIEANLLEPECILLDNNKAEVTLIPIESYSSTNQMINSYGNATINLKENVTIERVGKLTNLSELNSVTLNREEKINDTQMHSIFQSFDKRSQPKEVFTQCHFCGKFVISRMCSDTGTYSKCIHCFNSPFNTFDSTSFEYEHSDDEPPLPLEPEISIETNVQFSVNLSAQPMEMVQSRSENAFKCDQCGKVFTRNWYLKQHVKLHLNQKPFGCELCDKRFLNTSNLKQHMRMHSVEYRCQICQKTCINQSSLDEHIIKHEESGTQNEITNDSAQMECNYCPQKFASVSCLKEHLLNHTKDLPFHCDECDKGFRYNNTLAKHKKSHKQNDAI